MADFPLPGETKCSLFLGRFSPFHNGHLKIVNKMIDHPIVTIVKGKTTGADKDKNPFPVELQEKWVKMCTDVEVTISPNGFLPGILGFFRKQGKEINTIYCGADRIDSYTKAISDANKKMEEKYHYHVTFIEGDRVTSATAVREAIRNDDIETFEKNVPRQLWDEYHVMRKYIVSDLAESVLQKLSMFDVMYNSTEPLSIKHFSALTESVVNTKRVGLTHLDKMKPVEFLDFVKFARNELKGIIPKTTTVKLKLDGLNLKFGKDPSGKIFIEGARTGAVFDEGTFVNYAKSKGAEGEVLLRSQHYEDMLSFFKTAPFMKVIPNDCKIDCEMFYNPLGNEDGDSIKYVEIRYPKAKMGSFMTIAPYSCIVASSGDTHPDAQKIISNLFDQSNDRIKIVKADLSIGKEIDISAIIDPLESLLNDTSYAILTSRKHADKEQKENLVSILQNAKDELRKYLMFHPNIEGLDRLVDNPEDNEGTVWHLPNGRFKMTTDSFQATKKKV